MYLERSTNDVVRRDAIITISGILRNWMRPKKIFIKIINKYLKYFLFYYRYDYLQISITLKDSMILNS